MMGNDGRGMLCWLVPVIIRRAVWGQGRCAAASFDAASICMPRWLWTNFTSLSAESGLAGLQVGGGVGAQLLVCRPDQDSHKMAGRGCSFGHIGPPACMRHASTLRTPGRQAPAAASPFCCARMNPQ
jgi:hypothetical protein